MPDCINKLLDKYFSGDKYYGANLHVRLVSLLGTQGCLNKPLVTLFRTSCPQTILASSLYTILDRSLGSKVLQQKLKFRSKFGQNHFMVSHHTNNIKIKCKEKSL